jgi:hypothetical protein
MTYDTNKQREKHVTTQTKSKPLHIYHMIPTNKGRAFINGNIIPLHVSYDLLCFPARILAPFIAKSQSTPPTRSA